MKFTELNLNSTKPFYLDENDNIYNCKYELMKGSVNNNSHSLTYVKKVSLLTVRSQFSRIIYSHHFPEEDISDYGIYRKDYDSPFMYKIDNLIKVPKTGMPSRNRLPEFSAGLNPPIKVKFYEELDESQLADLIKMLKDPIISNGKIAERFFVSSETVRLRKEEILKLEKIEVPVDKKVNEPFTLMLNGVNVQVVQLTREGMINLKNGDEILVIDKDSSYQKESMIKVKEVYKTRKFHVIKYQCRSKTRGLEGISVGNIIINGSIDSEGTMKCSISGSSGPCKFVRKIHLIKR